MNHVEQKHQDKHNSAKLHCFRTFSDGSIHYNQSVNQRPEILERWGREYFYTWEPLWTGCPYWEYYQAPIVSPIEAAKEAVKEAREAIDIARGDAPNAYHTHRDVELIPCDSDGARCLDGSAEPDYLALKELSGKAIKESIKRFKRIYPDFDNINIYGGVDEYDSLHEFLTDEYAYYEPGVETWEFTLELQA